jgi:Cu/Ag efflux protein CusF
MKIFYRAAVLVCVCMLLGCNGSKQPQVQAAPAKRYPLKGKIISIDQPGKMAIVDAEAIPDFMGAMAMPYQVRPETELQKLKPGDTITAQVVAQDERYWLEDVRVTGQGAPQKSP